MPSTRKKNSRGSQESIRLGLMTQNQVGVRSEDKSTAQNAEQQGKLLRFGLPGTAAWLLFVF